MDKEGIEKDMLKKCAIGIDYGQGESHQSYFKSEYLQQPTTLLTEENLEKLEKHCRKAIRYEKGIEHQIVLELLFKYKELEQKESILDKVTEECRKQMKEYEDSILEIFPQRILKIIEGEKK